MNIPPEYFHLRQARRDALALIFSLQRSGRPDLLAGADALIQAIAADINRRQGGDQKPVSLHMAKHSMARRIVAMLMWRRHKARRDLKHSLARQDGSAYSRDTCLAAYAEIANASELARRLLLGKEL